MSPHVTNGVVRLGMSSLRGNTQVNPAAYRGAGSSLTTVGALR
jgi:hypothetical protein